MAEPAKTTNGNGKAAPTGTSLTAERKEMAVLSQAFTASVIKEMSSIDESIQITPYQKKLIEHLFIHVDMCLKELEAKRLKDGDTKRAPIVWTNVNTQKLALTAMHRVELGLDALIPGTIYPIPYFNGKLQKYDLDLRIGYIGEDYYKRKMAVDPPRDVIYELVYSKDKFIVHKKGVNQDVETYELRVDSPFDRGEVVGGFGYIVYDDPTKNKLVIVDKKEFDRAQKAGKSGGSFWKDWDDRMQFKTIVHRTLKHVKVDAEKVNQAYFAAEADMIDRQDAEAEIDHNANRGRVIDITEQQKELTEGTRPEPQPEIPEPEEAEQNAPPQADEKKRSPGF